MTQRLLKYCHIWSISNKHIFGNWRLLDVNKIDRSFLSTENPRNPNSSGKPIIPINEERCDLILQRLSDKNNTSAIFAPSEIYNLPVACLQWKKETTFVEPMVFQNWLSLLEANLGQIAPFRIVRALRQLKTVNRRANVKIQRMLTAELIMKFSVLCLQSVSAQFATTEEQISSFLDLLSFLLFVDWKSLSPEQEITLKTQLSKSLDELTDKFFAYPEKYFSCSLRRDNNFGKILFRLSKLNINKPHEDYIKKIVAIYSTSLGSHRGSTDLSYLYLLDLDAFIQSFLMWDINANLIETNFWSKCIAEVPRHFPFIRSSLEGRLIFLRTVLHLAIEYDEEKEFNKMKFLWLDNLRLLKSYFCADNVKTLADTMNATYLLDKMNKKYFLVDRSKVIDEFGFQPIKTLLESL